MRRYYRSVGRFILLMILTGALALAVAFLYQPRTPESRLRRIGRRVRIVAYSYVAAILLSAAGRLIFGWGT
jgi:hypothetical protein